MGVVIALPKPAERLWICNCGCSTFELRESGTALCAGCGLDADIDGSGWSSWTAENGQYDETTAFRDVQGNGSVDFARRRVADMASDEDAQLLVVARQDGSVSLWSSAETRKQVAWAKRKIREAAALLQRKL